MGSCVSVHKDTESILKLRLSIGSKNDKLLIPSPPVKHNPNLVNGAVAGVALQSQWSHRFSGSKEETFFDSQPWMESDCEDDFFSVNGDFTPSRGNTPVHHSFSLGHLHVNKPPLVIEETTINNDVPDPSPASAKKKRLSELFEESRRADTQADEKNAAAAVETTYSVLESKSTNGTPYLSGTNSVASSTEITPNGVLGRTEGKSVKSSQCCLPRLVSTRSFSERKKRMASPAPPVLADG